MSHPVPELINLTGHLTQDDKRACDYTYLSFDVPKGIDRIDVQYDYTRTSFSQSHNGEENVLDIGLFSPDAFRGWSGGARTEFFVSLTDATPGYLAGLIPEGTWRVILGLYKIGPDGCDYTANIGLSYQSIPKTEQEYPVRRSETHPPPSDSPLTWYVGDLQAHTHHSDAGASVAQISRVAASRGLDFLAVTDHNTISHHPELERFSTDSLLLLPGMEITTNYGHANIWGLEEWVDFRHRSHETLARHIKDVQAQDSLVSINHPFTDCPWTFGWMEGVNAIEVWQGIWSESDLSAVAWWDQLLTSGERISGVGGSDRHEPEHYDPHFPHQVGTPATRVKAQGLTTHQILDGILRGRVAIASTPAGPWLDLKISCADGRTASIGDSLDIPAGEAMTVEVSVQGGPQGTLELISAGVPVARRACRKEVEQFTFVAGKEVKGYIRAQLIADPEPCSREADRYPKLIALTNPIYVGRYPASP